MNQDDAAKIGLQQSILLNRLAGMLCEEKGTTELFETLISMLPSASRIPEKTVARVAYGGWECASPGFRRTAWGERSSFGVEGGKSGELEIYFLEPPPGIEQPPVLSEGELVMLRSATQMLRTYFDRREKSQSRQDAEEALRKISVRNEMILNSVGEGIYGTDINGNIVFANPALGRILAFHRSEMVGKNSHRLFHYARPDGTPYPIDECPLDRALRQGSNVRQDDFFWAKDGTPIPVEYIATPLFENGRVIGAVNVIRDISERKRTEEQLRSASEYARSLIEASLDPLVTISPDGKITDVNRATEEATGLGRDRLIGTDFANYFTDPAKAREGYRLVLKQGFVRDYPISIRHSSGRVMDVLYNATVYRNSAGGIEGVFAAARDVTQLKHAELELRSYREHLEDLVKQRTTELQRANERLGKLNEDLENFTYSVSHDLRAPLRAIEGFSSILREDYEPKLDPEGKRVLNVIGESTRKMRQLIEDILMFSRASRMEIEKNEVRMQDLVNAVIDDLKPTIGVRKIEFDVHPMGLAWVDRKAIRQVLQNLLENAVKFTRPRPDARIEVGSRDEDGRTLFYVKDNGVGFEMRYANKLFQVFQRLHSAEQFEGTGAGLAIVKQIVEKHGGSVWAESKPDEGATFFFSIPREKARENTAAA